MRLSRALSPALAALALSGALGAGLLSPAGVHADPPEVSVQNALDLTTLALDVTSLLLAAANGIGSPAGISSAVLTPLGIAQTLAFAPATFGAPMLRGVLRSMCTA
ncbi:hypothetical protein [Nocardia spumae]|uniref:hypothetical protein n=1 Tax=Nocardia spumae TaxID=2887190 RepID=UPI001D1593DD|nr:hypothetical protein [Nocardia spumae]